MHIPALRFLTILFLSKILSVAALVSGISVQISQTELGIKCLHIGICKLGFQPLSALLAGREE